MIDSTSHKIKGMAKDLALSYTDESTQNLAIDCHNIRITATEDGTLYSVTNEKGNKELAFIGETPLEGDYLGHAVLDNYCIIFTTDKDKKTDTKIDRIYRIEFIGNTAKNTLLFEGNLNFDKQYKIETLVFSEREDIKKVYWTDGKNQIRFINILDEPVTLKDMTSVYTGYDFVPTFKLPTSVSITPMEEGISYFPGGTVQYVCTYYNKYRQETNPFYASPLFYTVNNAGGVSGSVLSTSSFKIKIKKPDEAYKYINIYSIVRSSLNGTPLVKRVINLKIEGNEIIYIDHNNEGETIPSPELIFTKSPIAAGTITQKNATLFTGDITLTNELLKDEDKDAIKSMFTFTVDYKDIPYDDSKSLYPWYNSAQKHSEEDIKGFKSKAVYRVGVQLMRADGTFFLPLIWQNIYIDEVPSYDNGVLKIPNIQVEYTRSAENYALLLKHGVVAFRAVMAEPLINKNVFCQGVLNPTLFYIEDLIKNAPFCMSSYFFRPILPGLESNELYLKSAFGALNYKHLESVGSSFPKNREILFATKSFTISGKDIAKTYKEFYTVQLMAYKGWSPLLLRNFFEEVEAGKGINTFHSFKAKITVAKQVLGGATVTTNVYNFYEPILNTKVIRGHLNSTFLELRKDDDHRTKSKVAWKNLYNKIVSVIGLPLGDWEKIRIKQGDSVNIADPARYFRESDYLDWVFGTSTYNEELWNGWGMDKLPIGETNLADIDEACVYVLNEKEVSSNEFDILVGDSGMWSSAIIAAILSAFDLNASPSIQGVLLRTSTLYINQLVLTVNSPDILKYQSLLDRNTNIRVRQVGVIPITGNITDYEINLEGGFKHVNGLLFKNNYNKVNDKLANSIYDVYGLTADILMRDYYLDYDRSVGAKPSDTVGQPLEYNYYIYPWHKEGLIEGSWSKQPHYENIVLTDGPRISSKILANLRFSNNTNYENSPGSIYNKDIPLDSCAVFNSDAETVLQLVNDSNRTEGNDFNYSLTYKGNVDKVLSWKETENGYSVLEDSGVGTANNAVSENAPPEWEALDPIRIRYKSTPHAVLRTQFNTLDELLYTLDPTSLTLAYLPLVEFYVDYGDLTNSDELADACNLIYGTLEITNRFLPISNITLIGTQSTTTILKTWGDTFYQRWDCMKTYPYAEGDTNSIVEILSFMVESELNLDCRYDGNRGNINLVNLSPINFNLFNTAYNQSNNYFTYRILDEDLIDITRFPNQIIYSLNKSASEEIDSWTGINAVSLLNLDGSKGKIERLFNLKDLIFALQDKALTKISFNDREMLNTENGTPIQLANSSRVDGYVVIENVGCANKQASITTDNYLYFVDKDSSTLYRYSDKLENMSFLMHTWFREACKNYLSMKLYYDKANHDLYINEDNKGAELLAKCLCYNEDLQQFISTYDYVNVDGMFTVDNNFYSYKGNKLWKHWANEKYCQFYGNEDCGSYWVEVVSNKNPEVSKVFEVVEFRADSWVNGKLQSSDSIEKELSANTFNKLIVSNEYQCGESDLTTKSLKRKFRTWRALVPRDRGKDSFKDRIVNPWAKVKLLKDNCLGEKTQLHDLKVYFS